jgi:organic hydroperoxide reductase OsmC/OhrA
MTPDEWADTNTAVSRWQGGWRCEVVAGGFSLVIDEPEAVGGSGSGPMPTDLFLASLSSCFALALAWAARKRGFELPDLEVTAIGSYQGPRFAALELAVTSSLDPARLAPLLEPAKRVCYVSNTLAQAPPITITTTRTG